ncbi:MAG: formylglycine-generating enzyme family protein [Prosthecobacter sp.]
MRPLLSLLALAATAAQAQTPTLELDLGNGVRMDMILVQPGSFMQGSPSGEAGREADEGPQRRVTITRAYYMAKFPVTRSQFERFAEAVRYRTEAEKGESGGFGVVNGKMVQQRQFNWRNPGFDQSERDPVGLVSAPDAAAFCKWLTAKTGRQCELPTEAQWEYACRAGGTGARYAEPVDAVAWHRGNSGDATNEVGRKEANAWGFHDFYGPVWQWCRDWYAPYTPGNATDPLQTNPNLSDKPRQVLRGGSFLSDVSHARSAERYRNDARSRNADNGFRIVCSITQRAAAPAKATTATQRRVSEPPASGHSEPSSKNAPSIIGWGAVLFAIIVPLLVGFFILRAVFRQVRDWMTPGAATPTNMTGAEAATMFSAKGTPLGHRFAFNLTDDGFFITGHEDAVGTRLKYECVVGGRMIADDIVFTPGPEGHFVFTGKRPSSVRVQTTGGTAGTEGGHSSFSDDDDYHRRNMSSSSSSRYPSAY